ncbi:MspA family porin [Gordonia sp. CPCC 205333]|uniref:MspA family porin n=1 Tax=Gordonia sp. CPCC 205333 TaxID=3140790 RepID=UPI003AF3CAC7
MTAAIPLANLAVAQADTNIHLPSQTLSRTLPDGTRVLIKRSNESARINPSMGSTPLHRNAWVSGRYDVTVSDKSAKFGIGSGYIVACQLTLGGSANGGTTGTASNYTPENATVTAQTGAGVTIGPGQAANYFINDIEYQDPFGARAHENAVKFRGGNGAVVYRNETMMINGCAGYAQARAYVKVRVITDKVSQSVFLYGKPFSLG